MYGTIHVNFKIFVHRFVLYFMLSTLVSWLFPFSVLHWFVSCFFCANFTVRDRPLVQLKNSDGALWRRPASVASCPILTFSSTWQSLTRWNVGRRSFEFWFGTVAKVLWTVVSTKSWKADSLVLSAYQACGCCIVSASMNAVWTTLPHLPDIN